MLGARVTIFRARNPTGVSAAADSLARVAEQDGHQSGTELIITKGAQLAGALVGGGVGMVGGPVGAFGGAAAGWAVGEVITAIGVEVMQRMSGRGAERAAATAILIAQDGLEHGKQ
jgi:hypothetical protein